MVVIQCNFLSTLYLKMCNQQFSLISGKGLYRLLKRKCCIENNPNNICIGFILLKVNVKVKYYIYTQIQTQKCGHVTLSKTDAEK